MEEALNEMSCLLHLVLIFSILTHKNKIVLVVLIVFEFVSKTWECSCIAKRQMRPETQAVKWSGQFQTNLQVGQIYLDGKMIT